MTKNFFVLLFILIADLALSACGRALWTTVPSQAQPVTPEGQHVQAPSPYAGYWYTGEAVIEVGANGKMRTLERSALQKQQALNHTEIQIKDGQAYLVTEAVTRVGTIQTTNKIEVDAWNNMAVMTEVSAMSSEPTVVKFIRIRDVDVRSYSERIKTSDAAIVRTNTHDEIE